ncbi:MAG: sulfurtransferase TusA [Marinagarivorans sp.]|nr:sulfurtransferase TusA [Marinagarivorans sp.]
MTTEIPRFDHLLDTQGLYCPEPVMLLHGAIADMNAGETIKVIATDPSTERDIPKFCEFLGHSLLLHKSRDDLFEFYIKSKGHPE